MSRQEKNEGLCVYIKYVCMYDVSILKLLLRKL